VTLIDDDYEGAGAAGLPLSGEVILGFGDPFGPWPPGDLRMERIEVSSAADDLAPLAGGRP
jgi:hypothetical protein